MYPSDKRKREGYGCVKNRVPCIYVCLCLLGRNSGLSGGKGMNKDPREATERFPGQ